MQISFKQAAVWLAMAAGFAAAAQTSASPGGDAFAAIREDWLVDAQRAAASCPPDSTASVLSLSLNEAIESALCHQPKVRGAWVDFRIQNASVGEAMAAYLPSATMSVSHLNERIRSSGSFFSNEPTTTSQTTQIGSGSINWRLFDFGERSGNRKAALGQESAARSAYHATLHEVRRKTVAAYFNVLLAQGFLAGRQESENLQRQMQELMLRRQRSGSASLIEVSRVTSMLASASLERGRARQQLDKAWLELSQAVGLPLARQTPVLAMPAAPGRAEVEEFMQKMEQAMQTLPAQLQDRHPQLASLRSQIQSNLDKAQSFRGQMLPRLDFVTNVFRNGSILQGINNDTTRVMAGVTVTVPLFDGLANNFRMLSALRQAEKRETDLLAQQMEVLNELVRDYTALQTAYASLDSSRSLQEAAETGLQSARRRLDRGESDMAEWLNTRMAINDARLESFRATSEWQAARLQMLLTLEVIGNAGEHGVVAR